MLETYPNLNQIQSLFDATKTLGSSSEKSRLTSWIILNQLLIHKSVKLY